MRQVVTKEVERETGIEEQPDEPQANQKSLAHRELFKTILLNLILATTVCMARAALDYLVEGYGNSRMNQREDYARGGYPF